MTQPARREQRITQERRQEGERQDARIPDGSFELPGPNRIEIHDRVVHHVSQDGWPHGTRKLTEDAEVETAAVGNFLVTHEGVSDETAYQMTKQLFENLPDMVAAHNAAKAIDIKKALDGMPVPLHPGAERYYKEAGLL